MPEPKKTAKQCKTCPWKVGVDPLKDIPNGYSVEKHKALACTIREGGESLRSGMPWMACHNAPVGKETPCAGWLHNQLGVGNNLGLRLGVISGRAPAPYVEGPQHQRLEDTFPKEKVTRIRRRRQA